MFCVQKSFDEADKVLDKIYYIVVISIRGK